MKLCKTMRVDVREDFGYVEQEINKVLVEIQQNGGTIIDSPTLLGKSTEYVMVVIFYEKEIKTEKPVAKK